MAGPGFLPIHRGTELLNPSGQVFDKPGSMASSIADEKEPVNLITIAKQKSHAEPVPSSASAFRHRGRAHVGVAVGDPGDL